MKQIFPYNYESCNVIYHKQHNIYFCGISVVMGRLLTVSQKLQSLSSGRSY
jgi:hypothetical protein